jgi:hypothetical protein
MLSLQEQEKLKRIMELLIDQPQEVKSNIHVSNRLRDQEGRFLPNQSKSPEKDWSLRSIRVIKVKGSYGTYLIKDGDSFERLVGVICLLVAIAALTIIF